MRIWTLHPRYLDPAGLVALWREGLLARAVLRGKTSGYRHHPQLHRFRQQAAPLSAINTYLAAVLSESRLRGYSFDATKVGPIRAPIRLASTEGQLRYEWQHLLRKLKHRNPAQHRRLRGIDRPEPHPLFQISPGPTESWERTRNKAGRGKASDRNQYV